ncbi:MAG TPA: hypothetical protein VK125_02990 [Bacillota bacterium]|nr:hypothetical protein [Bacillota bacterium]
MKEKIPLYSTVAILVIFIFVSIGFSNGIDVMLYWLIVPASLILIGKILFKYVNEVLASLLITLIVVVTVHVSFRVLPLTLLLGSYLFALITLNYTIKNKKIASIAMNVVSVIFVGIVFYFTFQNNA